MPGFFASGGNWTPFTFPSPSAGRDPRTRHCLGPIGRHGRLAPDSQSRSPAEAMPRGGECRGASTRPWGRVAGGNERIPAAAVWKRSRTINGLAPTPCVRRRGLVRSGVRARPPVPLRSGGPRGLDLQRRALIGILVFVNFLIFLTNSTLSRALSLRSERHSTAGRSMRPFTLLGAWLLVAQVAAAQDPPPPPPPVVPSLPLEPEPVRQWLDEVRAQRQVREERRRAQKEAMDARRRWIDPWGAAQKEVREQENQRRHDALMEHIERDREVLRQQLPWRFVPDPWFADAPRTQMQRVPAPATAGNDPASQAVPPHDSAPRPELDNGWYYRGF